MSSKTESVILCEGYHDRAFWAAWLLYLGMTDRGDPNGADQRTSVLDPWGKKVERGQFGFYSESGKFVRVFPCRDRRNTLREAENRLNNEQQRQQQQAATPQLTRLVLNVDADTDAGSGTAKTGFRREDLKRELEKFDDAVNENDDGDFALFDGATLVSLVRWEANDSPRDGLPNQQTLERLVCASITAVYPERAEPIQKWLSSRPDAPQAGPKEFGWSHMAGWYADAGCEAFFRVVWTNARVRDELKARLVASGAWRIAESLAQ